MEHDSDLLGGAEIHSNASLFLSSMICDRSESIDETNKYGNLSSSYSVNGQNLITTCEMNLVSCSSYQGAIDNIHANSSGDLGITSDFSSAVLSPLMPLEASLASHSSSDIPSTVIIVSRANMSSQVTSSYINSQVYDTVTSVIDISPFSSFTTSSLSSSLSSSSLESFSVTCSTSVKSQSVPLRFLSTTAAETPSIPSIQCPKPQVLPVSNLTDLVDLQPLEMAPFEMNHMTTTFVPPVSAVPVSSPQNLKSNDFCSDRKMKSNGVLTSPEAKKPAAAYDFSPSKESPPRSLKSTRRRPPPPPVGSYKNQKNYFSKLKTSNLRRAVLEKSLVGKSPGEPHGARKVAAKPAGPVEESQKGDSKSCFDDVRQIEPNVNAKTPSLCSDNLKETSESRDNPSEENVADANVPLVPESSQSNENVESSGECENTTAEVPDAAREVQRKEDVAEQNSTSSAPDVQESNKRKRGRPRKNEGPKAPGDPNASSAATTLPEPHRGAHKRNLNTIVTRHSVFRKSSGSIEAYGLDDDDDDDDQDFSPPRKRAYRKRAPTSANESPSVGSSRKGGPSFREVHPRRYSKSEDPQVDASLSEGQTPSVAKNKSEVSKKRRVVLQGGFKKSKSFLNYYIQTSQNDDILFPHITQDDVCMFKLANQFYKEHKDKAYDIFSHDSDEELQHHTDGKTDVIEDVRASSGPKRLSGHGQNLEKEKCEGKTDSGEVVAKRGRGRPRINRDFKEMQSPSESERKKKKLISSILRELGDQDNSKRTLQCTQNISTMISRENNSEKSLKSCSQRLNPISPTDAECDREVRSFVTFVTPKKHAREESSSVESTPLKKTRMEGRPSMFLQFGSDGSSGKNFVTFESLISRSAPDHAPNLQGVAPGPPIVSFVKDVDAAVSAMSAEEQVKKSMQPPPRPADSMDSKKPEETSKRDAGQDARPKCSCKHVCGLQDTYLSSPYKRPPSQAANPPPSRVDSRTGVLSVNYPPAPAPQSMMYQSPFTAPANILAYDPHKHLLFPNASGDNLRDQQQQQQSQAVAFLGGSAVRFPGGNLAQPPGVLCRHDSPSPMISLVMAPNGYGYYAIPMAVDEKVQMPPVNQQGPILVPYVVNGFSALQADGSKSLSSGREALMDAEKSSGLRALPSPVQPPAPTLSSPSPRKTSAGDVPQSSDSARLLESRNSATAPNHMDNAHSKGSVVELNNPDNNDLSSSNYNASILSSSPSYCGNESQSGSGFQDPTVNGQFNQNLSVHRETPAVYFSASGNVFGASSNVDAFVASNSNGRMGHNYLYEDCNSSTRYFHAARRSHYDGPADHYNHLRVAPGSTRAAHPSNRHEGFAAAPTALHGHPNQSHTYDSLAPQFTYTSYVNNGVAPAFGQHSQSFFGAEIISESSKRSSGAFGSHYRREEHVQRLGGKGVQNGLNSSLWS